MQKQCQVAVTVESLAQERVGETHVESMLPERGSCQTGGEKSDIWRWPG